MQRRIATDNSRWSSRGTTPNKNSAIEKLINRRISPKVHLDGKKESVSSAKSLGFHAITKLQILESSASHINTRW
jgi:hypothetical protein